MTNQFQHINHIHRNFHVAFWNANGIRYDKYLIGHFLEENDIDILLVNETHLNQQCKLTIRGYEVYRNDKGSYGGTAVIIKSGIYHRLIDSPLFHYIEGTFVEVSFPTESIVFGAVYCSPSKPLIKEDLDLLSTVGRHFLLGGDYNAKNIAWNSRVTTPRGRKLELHSQENNYHILASLTPTYFPYNPLVQPDILDIALYKGNALPAQIITTDDFSSDHKPVIVTLCTNANARPELTRSHYITNWALFRDYINESLSGNFTVSSTEELDAETEIFMNTVTTAMKLSTGKIPDTKKALLPFNIREMIKEKKRARKMWHLTRNREHKKEYNKLKNQVHKAVFNNMLDKLDKDIEDANNTSNIWKITRRLTKPHKNCRTQPVYGINGPEYTDGGKARVLADAVESHLHPAKENDDLSQHFNSIRQEVGTFLKIPAKNSIRFTTPSEVKKIVKKLSGRTAPGKDEITNTAIRNIPKKAVTFMIKLFNTSMKLQHFPSSWKLAMIVTIPKANKNPQYPENRRPISLISTIGKLLEKIILNRIKEINLKCIPDHQMAFQPGCSTTHQILRLVESATKGYNMRAYTPAIFLDISKAYDSVWHTGLIYKLMKSDLPDVFVKFIASFLSRRKFQIREGTALSSIHEVHAGLPQGSVLGPILYNIYTADIPIHPETNIAQFADDTAVFITHQNPLYAARTLQVHIHLLENWFQEWRLTLNADKTQAICFTKCTLKRIPKLNICNKELEYQPTVKYLGVTLDQRLSWHQHLHQTKGKAIGRIVHIFPLLKSSAISIKRKLHLYKALVLPIITYAAPSWGYMNSSAFKPLQVVQNKALRLIHGSDWFTRTSQIHEDLGMPYIHEVLIRIIRKFYSRLQRSPNSLIKRIGDYNVDDYRMYRTPKMAIFDIT